MEQLVGGYFIDANKQYIIGKTQESEDLNILRRAKLLVVSIARVIKKSRRK
jgi:hypothetical protein